MLHIVEIFAKTKTFYQIFKICIFLYIVSECEKRAT